MELISIIVPVYKVEEFLECCITSLVNQTYWNLEIILVDDGSPDQCGAICDTWAKKDTRIRVIHKQNGGLSDARNAGLEIATGEYIAFVDSDDWIDLNYYEVLYKQMYKYEADIVASGVIYAYKDHKDVYGNRFTTREYSSVEALKTIQNNQGFLAVAWNKLYARKLFQEVRYPCGLIHEDEFVTYRLISNAKSLVLCQDVNYYYRQRQGSIMDEPDCNKEKFVLNAYLDRIALFQKKYPQLYVKDKYLFCLSCYTIYQLAKRQNNNEVMQEIIYQRKKISFSLKELVQFSIKEKIYILGTAWSLSIFCNILQWRK